MLAGDTRVLRICNVSAPVRRVLELTGLNDFLPLEPSELDALESIGGARSRTAAAGASGRAAPTA